MALLLMIKRFYALHSIEGFVTQQERATPLQEGLLVGMRRKTTHSTERTVIIGSAMASFCVELYRKNERSFFESSK